MLEDPHTVKVSNTRIMNWEDDIKFDDGMRCNTDPELDPDRTFGTVLTDEQRARAERKIRKTNQRLLIVAVRKLAYDMKQKSELDKQQNKILKPIYSLAVNFKAKALVIGGLMITAIVMGVWNLVLTYFGIGGG